MSPLRLITIPMSHYCEKARWGLERLGLAYTEERHMQGFHYPRTLWVSGGRRVPVLVDGNKVVSDSTAILRHLDGYTLPEGRLYPEDAPLRTRVEALEDRFDEVLGVESRRWVYFHYLTLPDEALAIASQGAPASERVLFRAMFPLLGGMLRRGLEVTRENVEAGLARSRAVVTETDALLSGGGGALVGDCFTAADLSLACMLAPFVLPPNYGVRLPTLEEAPEAMRSVVREFRATRTGDFVMRLFETQRASTVDLRDPRAGAPLPRCAG